MEEDVSLRINIELENTNGISDKEIQFIKDVLSEFKSGNEVSISSKEKDTVEFEITNNSYTGTLSSINLFRDLVSTVKIHMNMDQEGPLTREYSIKSINFSYH